MKISLTSLTWAAIGRFVVVALFFDALAPLLPAMANSNQLSTQQFQLLLGVCYIAFSLSQLASVPIIAMLGVYRPAALSCILLGIAGLTLCAANDAVLFSMAFLAMFAVNGIGANATRVALREANSDQGFKRILAWASGIVEVKQIAMPALVGIVAATFGWRWALVMLVLPVLMIGLWLSLAQRGQRTDTTAKVAQASNWRNIMMTPAFFMPTLSAASFQVSFAPAAARLPFFLSDTTGFDPVSAGLTLSCASGLVAAGMFLSGCLAPRRSSRNLIGIGIMVVFAGLSCMLAGTYFGTPYAIAGLILVQAAFGFIIIPCSADAIDATPSERVKASALFGFIQPIVGGLAVALAGRIPGTEVFISATMTFTSLCLLVFLLGCHVRMSRRFQPST
ncbi:MFS transporter [Herbaspirillum rhizosphaerae]|uniref:MFS transporter n=1 Tax=Herbaspirillum rhizosphaerae TaxID=346179 RepID=UPI00142F33C3|nr:MFS transporter [Herbaspirillum rhizosphaerae]